MENKDKLHLENIANFCENIGGAIAELKITRESFEKSSSQKAVLAFFVEHIGEEANKLSAKFINDNPEIEWKAVIGFRNRIVHAYVGIDPDVLWDTIRNDIPELHEFCVKKLQDD